MTAYDERDTFGSYLEEFHVGDTWKHWPGKTITEADNHIHSLLVMNHHPLHIDEEWNRAGQHGKILVNGTLVFSIVVGMTVRALSVKAIANLEYESVTHDGPVFHGDTIYAESEILEVRESRSRPDRGIVYLESHGINQRDENILTLRRRFLVPKRPVSGADSNGTQEA